MGGSIQAAAHDTKGPLMMVRCRRDDSERWHRNLWSRFKEIAGNRQSSLSTAAAEVCVSYPLPQEFTGLFRRPKIESIGKFRTPNIAVSAPVFGAHDCAQGNVVCDADARRRPTGEGLSYHQGGRRWLTYSLSARARVHQFQLVSGLSGFYSKAFLVSRFRCVARPAVKCTNGPRRMRG